MSFDPKVINALADLRVRMAGVVLQDSQLARSFNTLDNAGVFAALDEQTGYASALDVLEESARDDLEKQFPNTADPAEWGDTTTADMARHQLSGRESVSDPSMDDMARAAREIENLRPKGRGPAGA
jgi:hypothetical protein